MASKSARLAAVYARIPKMIDCDGSCDLACGPVVQGGMMTPYEYQRLADVPRIDHENPTTCTLLDAAGRCSAYELRPFICRLWGTTPEMRCPKGCVPERWITPAEGNALRREVILLSGGGEEFAFGDDTRQLLAVVKERFDTR